MTEPPHPPPLFTGEAGNVHRVPLFGWVARNRHFTVPPLLLPVILLAGLFLAMFQLQEAVILASAVALAMMCFAAPHKWDRTSERWYACLSTAAAGAWLSVASFTGLTLVMTCVAAGLTVAWGGFWWHHKRPRMKKGDAALITEWDVWWRYHARSWNLLGSQVTGVLSKGSMETLEVQLWKGRQHHGNVRDAAHLIASGLGGYVRPGMIRVDEHPDDPSKVLIRLKRADPLRQPLSWHVGLAVQSIMEAAAIGFTEASEHIKVSLLANWFIIGQSRWGKSNELSNMLAAITGTDDAIAWLVDMKGGRAARPWMAALDWCATGRDEISLMFDVTLAEIKSRARDAYTGEEQLTPTPEAPAIFLIIDETYEVTSMPAGVAKLASQLATISSQGMGVAVYVIVSTQYGALDESVRTEQTRGNLINRICFRVAEQRHGAFAIPEWDRLDASKLAQKGAFYYKLGPNATPAPGRGFEFAHPLVREVARRNGAMPRMPLRLYASEYQQVYDERWSRLPQAFWKDAPQTTDLEPASSPAPRPVVADVPALAGHLPDALGRAQAIEDELGSAPDIRESEIRMPSDADLRSAVERNKARLARALVAAPPSGITPKQLTDATGMSRAWVMSQVKALTDRGVLTKPGDGLYASVPGEDVWAAMEEIRLASGRLLERSA